MAQAKRVDNRVLNVTPETYENIQTWRKELERRQETRLSLAYTVGWLVDSVGPPDERAKSHVEIVKYDPNDPDTYPSVCQAHEEVYLRFGFIGGETLIFSDQGSYMGELTKQLEKG